MRNYYFLPSNAGTSVSEDGSSIKISTTYNLARLNIPAKTNNFAIEFKVLSASGNVALGIGNYSTSFSRTKYTGAYSDGCSINISDGTFYFNNIVVSTVSGFIAKQNDVVALRVDSKNNTIQYFKNGILVYTYSIQFSYQNLILEVGTGTQIDGEIQLNYEWVYNYNSLKYDSVGNRIALKNPTTNVHYSLSESTLVHLPDKSPKNMILHGIEQGKEIQLDVPFNKHRYFNDTSINSASGKVFTHDIGIINTLSIREQLIDKKNFEPIYTWHETEMTSDATPSPLVASASSQFDENHDPFNAFDGFSNSSSLWATLANAHNNSWIQIDFGNIKKINMIQLTPRNTQYINQTPKNFYVQTSIDGNNWINVGEFDISDWVEFNPKILQLKFSEARYCKIVHRTTNGGLSACWAEILYGLREVK